MKIWIDVGHPAQLNFYISTIRKLSRENQIFVTILDRGKLLAIAQKEIGDINNCKIIPIGRHRGTKMSVIFDVNIIRFFKLFQFCLIKKPNIALGNGFMHALIGKILKVPALTFSDDIERQIPFFLMKKFSSELYYVTGSDDGLKKDSKVQIFKALKEWSYLSPEFFVPSSEVLLNYDVEPNNYFFIREVMTGTINYNSQSSNLIATICEKLPEDFPVILSLENKKTRHFYPENWIVLQEPIEDIHSLIYHSRILISSGDSMAREGAILGVPSIYCGVREMKANNVMIKKGRLYHKPVDKVPNFMVDLLKDFSGKDKELFRQSLKEEWIDVSKFIIERINNIKI